MHSAAKTCSPTLLSSSMAPRTPPRTHTQGEPPGAPPTAAARAATPPDPRAPPGTIRRRGVWGGPQIPRRPMGSRGRGDPAWGVGGGIVCVRPLLFLPRGGGRCPAGAGTMGWPGPGLCFPGQRRGLPWPAPRGIPPLRPRQGLLLLGPGLRAPRSRGQSTLGLGEPAPVPAGPEQAAAAAARFSSKIVDYNRIKDFPGGWAGCEPRAVPASQLGTARAALPGVRRHRTHRGVRGCARSCCTAVVRCGRGRMKYGALQAWKKMSQHLREFSSAGPEPALSRAGAAGI